MKECGFSVIKYDCFLLIVRLVDFSEILFLNVYS